MKPRYILGSTLVVLLLLFAGVPAVSWCQPNVELKKKVVVFAFSDDLTHSARTWNRMTAGEGVSEMIITELVKSGKYRVIERDQIANMLAEKGIELEGDADNRAISDLGRALGAEIGIYGTITEFGTQSGKTGVNVPLVDVRVGVGKTTAKIALDVRMIDLNTGDILFAESVSRKKSVPRGEIDLLFGGFESEQQFNETMIGQLTRKAVAEVVEHIDAHAEEVAWQARVITVREDKIYINAGKVDGIPVGLEFIVYREEEELIDPESGINLGAIESEVGRIQVQDNGVGDGKASVCTALQGYYFQEGDIVRVRKTPGRP